LIRDIETRGSRPFLKYIQNIDNIRKIQDYIVSLAQEHGVKIVNSYNLDLTLNDILDYMNEILVREFEVPTEQKAASQIPLRV
jgi:2-phosphoglycerate kinase